MEIMVHLLKLQNLINHIDLYKLGDSLPNNIFSRKFLSI